MWRKDLDIDVECLAPTRQSLATNDDTVAQALDDEVRAGLRRSLAERIRSGAGIDRGEEIFLASRGR